jgi:hypothetical protein
MNITQEPTKDIPYSYSEVEYGEQVFCDHCGLEATVTKKDLKYDSDYGLRFPNCPKCKHKLTTALGSTVPTLTLSEKSLISKHKINRGCAILGMVGVIFIITICAFIGALVN